MPNLIKSAYNFVVFLNTFLLMIFIVLNFENLDEIEYEFTIGVTDYDYTINFYAVLGIIALIFVVTILASISILGSGLNEFGTKNIAKYMSILALISLFAITTSYFVLPLGTIGLMLEVIFLVVYLLNAIQELPKDS